ncbi:hypothetical protein AVEN_2726-1, partial [Araneus ventricosus]
NPTPRSKTPCVDSPLSSLFSFSSLRLPFLNPYLPDLRGVAEEFNLSDLSVCRTNHPTTNLRLPSRLIIGRGQNANAPLSASAYVV